MKKNTYLLLTIPLIYSFNALANDVSEVEDMSDPLAVFTQVGAGITDKGINLKIGQTYDTGKENHAGMNVFEVKGIGGETLGWADDDQRPVNDSIDSVRYRNFSVNTLTGRANQIDLNYDFNSESGTASYSFIQALPKFGRLNLYPLAGVGTAFSNSFDENGDAVGGYGFPGTFAVVGTYTKFEVTDNIWINYNPMWMTTLSGSDEFTQHGMENSDSVFTHELSVSYQFTPRFNVRYFANWTENTDFSDGDQRIEFNYQL